MFEDTIVSLIGEATTTVDVAKERFSYELNLPSIYIKLFVDAAFKILHLLTLL
jgi:hypothetical protein